jgi:uncharacterized protein
VTRTAPAGVLELSTPDCWALLRSSPVARLAVVVDGRPDIFPVNVVVDHGSVVLRTGAGTKHAAALAGPAVALEVDGVDPQGCAWSVVLKGQASEVRRLDELVATSGLPLAPWHAGPKPRFLRIAPETLTGRRFAVADGDAWQTAVSGVRPSPSD